MTPAQTCRERLDCRLCGSSALQPALTLTPTPPANHFLEAPEAQECFPLEVRVCGACGHSQLGHVVSGEALFRDYAYVSGTSPSFRRHFEEYANAVSGRVGLDQGDLVVEIGSNDGTLLKNFKARRIGVEPATNLAKQYATPGILTLNEFFTESLALGIRDGHGPAKLVLANNVMAHIDDLSGVVRGVKALLDDDGLFVFEVQYLGGLMEMGAFDLCYHEHLDFHAVTPLIGFFKRHGLRLVDVEQVPTHGGSIRCFVAPAGSKARMNNDSILRLVGYEKANALLTVTPWHALRARIDIQKGELRALLDHLKGQGRTVVGYGAPAKLTTLCYELGLDAKTLEYIVDDSPLKQGLVTPGLHIPVLPPGALFEDETGWPDCVLLTAWNFAPQIIEKCKALRENGTHFITPFPVLSVTP